MMRTAMTGAVALAAVLVLSACGGSESSGEPSGSGQGGTKALTAVQVVALLEESGMCDSKEPTPSAGIVDDATFERLDLDTATTCVFGDDNFIHVQGAATAKDRDQAYESSTGSDRELHGTGDNLWIIAAKSDLHPRIAEVLGDRVTGGTLGERND